jgi:two-component system chemotaxis sensor kinase CheA
MKKNDAFLKRLLATFKVEANEHIAAISSGLIELEADPSPERMAAVIETVFRESHSMKGAARSVNLEDIESVCQAVESVLAALKRKELGPSRTVLDLLHKAVNLLTEMVASLGTEGVSPERGRIRAAVAELNDAATGRARPAGPDLAKTAGGTPAADGGGPPSPAMPVLSSGSSDMMRISKSKLDSIMLQAEGFLAVKQTAAHQTTQLRNIASELAALRKEWAKIRPDLRAVRAAEKKSSGAAGTRTHAGGRSGVRNKLLDFFEAQEERIARLHHSLQMLEKTAGQEQRSIGAMVDGLLDDIKTVSRVPFSSLLELFPKVVRDLSRDQDKKALVTTQGGEIEIDKRILDEMRDPLIHLIRNCVDHGIEKPGERNARNKPEAGTITITVSHREGKSIEAVVSDDGRGIDTAKILDSAIKLGMITRADAKELDDQGIQQLMFRSGVTTSPIITDISGRGLGLAIVRERVVKLGGSLYCETAAGKGTTFRILLPLTLATFRGALVRVEDRPFLIPTAGLDRTLRVKRDEVRTVENRETITLDGRTIPFVLLGDVLELPRKAKNTAPEFVHTAVLGAGGHRIAFGVDEVLNEQEVLVKDLGRQLVRVRNVAAATVLGTGRVVPILNVSDLMKSAVRVSSAVRMAPAAQQPEERKSVLIVEDSITSRTLLKNILETSGYDVQTAVDGADAFAALKTGEFDLVVSDVDMPRMNGFELAAKVRADKKLSELPVILVTALESREDRERGIDVGANAYIVKSSFDKSNLLEAIRRLI